MLFVRRLRFIDSAEESTQWLSRTKALWDAHSPLAIRVYTTQGDSLGSSIPKVLRRYAGEPSWWGLSWIEQGEGEQWPTPTAAAPEAERTAPSAATEQTANEPASSVTQRGEAEEPTGSPVPAQAGEEPNTLTDTSHAVEASSDVVAPISERSRVTGAGANSSVSAHSTPSVSGGDEDDFNPPDQRQPVSSRQSSAAAVRATAAVLPGSQPGSLASEQCVPVDISGAVAEGGLIVVEVFALNTGRAVATLPVDVSTAFRLDASDIQHYALIMTPTAAETVDATTIHATLELTVVHRDYALGQISGAASREGTSVDADALAEGLRTRALPVVPVMAGAVACSTTQLFFPTGLLKTSGAFVVSNVVAVESTADAPVVVEVITSGADEDCLQIAPAKTVTLARGGERGYFVMTWSLVKPFAPGLRVHLLIRVGEQNYPPVDLHVHGEPPRPGHQNPPYCFWVNTTPVVNVSLGEGEQALVRSLLPVYKMLSILSAGPTPTAGAP